MLLGVYFSVDPSARKAPATLCCSSLTQGLTPPPGLGRLGHRLACRRHRYRHALSCQIHLPCTIAALGRSREESPSKNATTRSTAKLYLSVLPDSAFGIRPKAPIYWKAPPATGSWLQLAHHGTHLAVLSSGRADACQTPSVRRLALDGAALLNLPTLGRGQHTALSGRG